ncbi:MAG: hypothetical protein OEQ47_17630 [Acidimicrobiia bacterium]|nr:hypothetical protein [Acidimicrobiia bacterium]
MMSTDLALAAGIHKARMADLNEHLHSPAYVAKAMARRIRKSR